MCNNILRLYISSDSNRPVVTDSVAVPLAWTLPSLESNWESVFTARYCHISQCLILSNWVTTATLHSGTSTTRSVQTVASFSQRNWIKLTLTTEPTAGEIPKSNKSNCRYQTHMCRNAYTQTHTLTAVLVRTRFCEGWHCVITVRSTGIYLCTFFFFLSAICISSCLCRDALGTLTVS